MKGNQAQLKELKIIKRNLNLNDDDMHNVNAQ